MFLPYGQGCFCVCVFRMRLRAHAHTHTHIHYINIYIYISLKIGSFSLHSILLQDCLQMTFSLVWTNFTSDQYKILPETWSFSFPFGKLHEVFLLGLIEQPQQTDLHFLLCSFVTSVFFCVVLFAAVWSASGLWDRDFDFNWHWFLKCIHSLFNLSWPPQTKGFKVCLPVPFPV